MTDIARLASYGSWLNFFLCSATVTGVRSPAAARAARRPGHGREVHA